MRPVILNLIFLEAKLVKVGASLTLRFAVKT